MPTAPCATLHLARGACSRIATAALDVVDGARSRHRSAIGVIVGDESHEGAVHMQVSTIGLDLAKNVFQVHGIDANEKGSSGSSCGATS